jgi:TRAP-type mannitol/chloroaromatic compound transport system permease large subunit
MAILLVLLIGGVWIAVALAAVGWGGLHFFTSTPPEVNLFQSFWGSSASWTLAALPLFVWMGEILSHEGRRDVRRSRTVIAGCLAA